MTCQDYSAGWLALQSWPGRRRNRVSRRQGERWASQGQAVYGRPAQYAPEPEPVPTPPPAAPPPGGTDRIAALKDLAELKAQGVLTEAEFEREKARILAS